MNYKKNILLIITKLSNGGAEKAINLLAKRLKEKYNVYFVVFDGENNDYIPNSEIINLNIKSSKNLCIAFINLLKKISLVKQIKNKYNIDVTISFLAGPSIVNVFSKVNDKIIVSVRNNIKKNSFINRMFSIISMKKADKVVAVSKGVEELCIKKYKIKKEKIVTIYNSCDFSEINKLKNETFINDNLEKIFNTKKVVISIGRLINQKGYKSLIKSFYYICQKRNDIYLIILGRGKQKKKLISLIRKYNLSNSVILLDFVNNPYVILNKSKLFISNSKFEGMSNVIIEAMACELPIIASDCKYGNREIISNNIDYTKKIRKYEKMEFGILTPVNLRCINKEKIIADAIIELIDDDELYKYYKNKSKIRIKEFLNNIDRWEKIIEEE